MIVNEKKTEIKWICQNQPMSQIIYDGVYTLAASTKALGIYLKSNLLYNVKDENSIIKGKRFASVFRFLRKYFNSSLKQ